MMLHGCRRGVLGLALALLCLLVPMSLVPGPLSIVLFPISLVRHPPDLLSSKLCGPTSCPCSCTFGIPNQFGGVLPALSLLTLKTACIKLIPLPPTLLTNSSPSSLPSFACSLVDILRSYVSMHLYSDDVINNS